METNPNGANQHTPDNREQKCWDFYIESIIAGTPNAYASAIKAGYSEDHSRNITMQGWFKERSEELERKEMLSKAEKKLKRTLEYEVEKDGGEIKTDLLRIQADVSKYLTTTLGKDKGYSPKQEIEHKGLVINFSSEFNKEDIEKSK